MGDLVRYEAEDGVVILTLNRPERLNAITAALITELQQALSRADGDPGVRVVVLTGAGRAFCAGGDLNPPRDDRAPGDRRSPRPSRSPRCSDWSPYPACCTR
jgi:enoyl-CoA hydratase/carnithine racemase